MSVTYWNPADKHADISLGYSNTVASCSSASSRSVRATNSKSTGKWYYEVLVSGSTLGADTAVGIADGTTTDLAQSLAASGQVAWCVDGLGGLWDNGVSAGSVTTPVPDDYVGILVDLDGGYGWVYINGVLGNGSTDPPTSANADFSTLTGSVFPAFSSSIYEVAGTGKWLAIDMLLNPPPTGFSAWDAGAILPETCESNATATAIFGSGGSSLSITISSDAATSEELRIGRGFTFTNTAEATDDLSFRRGLSLTSNAVADDIATGRADSTITLTSNALAVALVSWRLTLSLASNAEATDDLTFRRGLSLTSNAVAVGTALAAITTTVVSAATAVAVLEGRRAFLLASTAVAEATLVGQRIVTQQMTSDAVAVAVLTGAARISMTLVSDAVAQAQASTVAQMMATIESNAEAEAKLRLPDTTFPALWTNTTTAAAASWDGVPFNSMIEVAGNVYAAGPDGLYRIVPKEKDNGLRFTTEVLWDLTDFGSAKRKRLGAVYVAGYAKSGFTVSVTNHQGSFEYAARLPAHVHATNHRAVPGKGLDSQFYRIGVTSAGYCEVKGVIVDTLETDRRI